MKTIGTIIFWSPPPVPLYLITLLHFHVYMYFIMVLLSVVCLSHQSEGSMRSGLDFPGSSVAGATAGAE